MNKRPIIVTGHPYAFPYYFKVFEYLENKDGLIFVLAKIWKSRGGQFKLQPKPGFTTYGLVVASFGGHGVQGLFKGWLPGLVFLLPYLKIKYKSKVLYSCSEPNLLTTLCNGLMAKMCGMKYVFFTWQNIEPQKYMRGLKLRIYLILVRLNLWLTDGVICGNQKAQKIVSNFRPSTRAKLGAGPVPHRNEVSGAGFPIPRTIVCPISGVDTERFRPGIVSSWRERLDIKQEEKLILFYGALDKRKGLDLLIDAFYVLVTNRQPPVTKLILVGRGPEKQNLESKIRNLGLKHKVICLDWLPNDQLPALINIADIFVYPSVPLGGWEEQFGYAMAEASASGIPVIATRIGSIEEVVKDGQTGILVKPNSVEELRSALVKLLSDDMMRQKMGLAGRKFVVENFSHKVIADKLNNFFDQFL